MTVEKHVVGDVVGLLFKRGYACGRGMAGVDPGEFAVSDLRRAALLSCTAYPTFDN